MKTFGEHYNSPKYEIQNNTIMDIKTKFNLGDIVSYDNGKRGKIIGYEIIFTPNP